MTDDASAATRSFYGRWAGLYDRFARLPLFRTWRERTVAALELEPGDTVVEMGCGTGANVPHLRERVGGEGRIVGLDLTRGMLTTARAEARRNAWDDVHVLQADATRPPIAGEADAVLATFVVGMLDDPREAVGTWLDGVVPGGRVALMDAAPTDRPLARPLNLPFAAFVRATAPGKRGSIGRPSRVLGERVAEAQDALRADATAVRTEHFAGGFLRLTSGGRPTQ